MIHVIINASNYNANLVIITREWPDMPCPGAPMSHVAASPNQSCSDKRMMHYVHEPAQHSYLAKFGYALGPPALWFCRPSANKFRTDDRVRSGQRQNGNSYLAKRDYALGSPCLVVLQAQRKAHAHLALGFRVTHGRCQLEQLQRKLRSGRNFQAILCACVGVSEHTCVAYRRVRAYNSPHSCVRRQPFHC